MDCVNIYEDAPLCCKDLCLNCDTGYCMSKYDNITPNDVDCVKFIGSESHQMWLRNLNKSIATLHNIKIKGI